MTLENNSWSILHERILPTWRGSKTQPPDHQSDTHPTEPQRPAFLLENHGLTFHSNSLPLETIWMKYPSLFSRKNNNILKCWYLTLKVPSKIVADNVLFFFFFFFFFFKSFWTVCQAGDSHALFSLKKIKMSSAAVVICTSTLSLLVVTFVAC